MSRIPCQKNPATYGVHVQCMIAGLVALSAFRRTLYTPCMTYRSVREEAHRADCAGCLWPSGVQCTGSSAYRTHLPSSCHGASSLVPLMPLLFVLASVIASSLRSIEPAKGSRRNQCDPYQQPHSSSVVRSLSRYYVSCSRMAAPSFPETVGVTTGAPKWTRSRLKASGLQEIITVDIARDNPFVFLMVQKDDQAYGSSPSTRGDLDMSCAILLD